MNIIGQLKLLNKINNYSYSSFPDAIILEGDRGSGKNIIIEYISNKFNIPYKDITSEITNDLIMDLYVDTLPVINVIDIDKASVHKRVDLLQNSILKLVEEPPNQHKVIITCRNRGQLLDTIQNRCQVFTISTYTSTELQEYCFQSNIDISDLPETYYKIFNTPGKLNNINHKFLEDMSALANLMITSIYKANISNILTISNRINFDKEPNAEKFDVDIFIDYFTYELYNQIKETTELDKLNYLTNYYDKTLEYKTKCKILNVNKKLLFDNYLLSLKGVL